MELQLHNVESVSVQSFDQGSGRETDDHYKIVRIKINGWQNVITLYCKDDVKIDLLTDESPKTSVTAWQDDLAAWQDNGGEG